MLGHHALVTAGGLEGVQFTNKAEDKLTMSAEDR